jgi:hypothetical protein
MHSHSPIMHGMNFLTMKVIDRNGPIVEIGFVRRIESPQDVDRLLAEAESFMEAEVRPFSERTYFVTCYDRLSVAAELVRELRDRFSGFNKKYSKANVRYGGSTFAKTFVIATSIKDRDNVALYPDRDSAVAAIRKLIVGGALPSPKQ